jgi:hypothetical protein
MYVSFAQLSLVHILVAAASQGMVTAVTTREGKKRQLEGGVAGYASYYVCNAGSAKVNGVYVFNGTASQPYIYRNGESNFLLKRFDTAAITGSVILRDAIR